jgi:hypothetical protein
MQKIFSGNDRARELGFKNYREFVIKLSERIAFKWDGETDLSSELALQAFVTGGRWAATCECGESYYVEPVDPIGYCYGGCGNANMGGRARAIVFPDDRLEIEEALLERELEGTQTAFDRLGTQSALKTNLLFPKILPRNWDGESPEELRKQHTEMKKIRHERKEEDHG